VFLPIYPYFADWPSERIEVLQCGPRGGGQRGSPELSEAGGRGWPGAGGGWPTSGRCSVSSLGWGGVRTGDDPRRRTLAASAAACHPARGGTRWGGARHCSIQGTAGRWPRGWVGARRERTGGITGCGTALAEASSGRRRCLSARGKGLTTPL
jgi:hypothetical protein